MKRKLLLISVLVVGACTATFAFAVMFTYQGTVVLGHLTEQDVTPEGTCGGVGSLGAGQAFVEPTGSVNQVMKPGPGAATMYWATICPQGGIDINIVENGPTCTL